MIASSKVILFYKYDNGIYKLVKEANLHDNGIYKLVSHMKDYYSIIIKFIFFLNILYLNIICK